MEASPELLTELEEIERELAAVPREENLATARFVREMNYGATPEQMALMEQCARRLEERARAQLSSS